MKKVLVVRTSAIGDIVFALPFAKALKETYPDAKLSWLVDKGNQPLLATSPYVDECITIPASEWKSLWDSGQKFKVIQEVLAFGRTLKERQFDVAIDLQGLLKSGIFVWLSNAKQKIGLGSKEGSQWFMNQIIPRSGDPDRISSEYLFLAEQLHFKDGAFEFLMSPDPTAEQSALEKLAQLNLAPQNYVVFAAFTTRPQKHWFSDAWEKLAQLVYDETKLTPVLLGGPADGPASEQIASNAPSIVNLVGKTKLAEAIAVIKNAKALIGVDTGLTHMGIAFNIPTVALFGSTCPYTNTTRDNAKVIWLHLPCSPCKRKPTCNNRFDCLRQITPEMALNTLKDVLRSRAS